MKYIANILHNITKYKKVSGKERAQMKPHTEYGRIRTDGSLRETAHHGSEEYPFQFYDEDIWQFDFHCVDWHWHPEVELVFIETGKAEFLIGGDRHTLSSGTGVFINSQVVHRFESTESTRIPNIVFSPTLLSHEESLVYQKYIRPVVDSPVKCRIFTFDDPGQKEILDTLLSVFAIQRSEHRCELRTVETLMRLWRMIYESKGTIENAPAQQPSARTQAQLQIMLQYIHKNYPYQITLDDIAKTVTLSKSSVLNIFHKKIHTSPVNYLLHYRLKCAAKLLAATEDSVLSIAHDTGFENVGYFCRKFKDTFQFTPGEYRKRKKDSAQVLFGRQNKDKKR